MSVFCNNRLLAHLKRLALECYGLGVRVSILGQGIGIVTEHNELSDSEYIECDPGRSAGHFCERDRIHTVGGNRHGSLRTQPFGQSHIDGDIMVELLEIFSGYLSNTLSFMRVAGLGIAHACLMVSFFTIAGMTSGILSVLILILGNMLVIGLEGLSAGIQALRLSYYEFFTKFFHGTGNLYTPISLSSRDK